jgi:hypothetical protein
LTRSNTQKRRYNRVENIIVMSDSSRLVTVPTPLLTTKLIIPPQEKVRLDRPHWLQTLGKCIQPGCRLTLISSPAGFEKNTLMSPWVDSWKAVLVLIRWVFVRTAPAKPVVNRAPYDAIDAYVEVQMHRLNMPGVSLTFVEGDKIVHLRGFGRARPGGSALVYSNSNYSLLGLIIDAIRAPTGIVKDASTSVANTDYSLGIMKEFIGEMPNA